MKEVKIKVVSERGHDTLTLSPQEAVERIKEEVTERGKWCYIDGNYVSVNTITSQDIEQANDITLTNALKGG